MQNLYLLDRLFRMILAIILIYTFGTELNMFFLMALLLLVTSSFGYCPLYKMLNINSSFEKENKFLTQLPKNNPEPVFIFSPKGNLLFQNNASKKILPELNFFNELSSKDTKELIKNEEKISTHYKYKDKTYLIDAIGIKKEAHIVAYGFNITEILKSKDNLN